MSVSTSDSANRRNIISARFEPSEADALRHAAARDDVTVSTFVKRAIAVELLRRKPGARTIRRPSGAELIWWTNAPDLVQVG